MVERSGAQAYEHFSRACAGIRCVFKCEDLGAAESSQENSFHAFGEFYGQSGRKQGLTFARCLRREVAAYELNRPPYAHGQIAAFVFAI